MSIVIILGCTSKTDYLCPPCDQACDTLVFKEPGICPHCKMALVSKVELEQEMHGVVDEVMVTEGTGMFKLSGKPYLEDGVINVYYNKPISYNPNNPIVIILPGAGRDGREYRDAWKAISENEGFLVAALQYPEISYPFEKYHLGGIVEESNYSDVVKFVHGTNHAHLEEDSLEFSLNHNPDRWLFSDIDRIFELIREATDNENHSYVLFGHSAGGQIAQRMALLAPNTKAELIIAANPGFFTLPDTTLNYPFGMMDLEISDSQLQKAFNRNLIIYSGKNDNLSEQRGTLLRSPSADLQGLDRNERANNFIQFIKEISQKNLKLESKWELVEVPDVGHDFIEMSKYASQAIAPLEIK